MTDQDDQHQDEPRDHPDVPGFDDPAYDDVRALLAGARGTDPVPDAVAARLDSTLAALQAERAGTAGDASVAPVVPLRRRSRISARVLVAATAVVVLGAGGVGMTQVLRNDGDQSATVASADAGVESPELAPGAPTSPAPSDLDSKSLGDGFARVSLPQFTADGFAVEAAAFQTRYRTKSSSLILDESRASAAPSTSPEGSPESSPGSTTPAPLGSSAYSSKNQELLSALSAAKEVCPGPIGVGAALFAIQYDGLPTALAIYPAAADSQRFEVWSCDGQTLLATTVVSSP